MPMNDRPAPVIFVVPVCLPLSVDLDRPLLCRNELYGEAHQSYAKLKPTGSPSIRDHFAKGVHLRGNMF